MICAPAPPTYRLLDPFVGWDPASCEGLAGCAGEGDGLRLAPAGDGPFSLLLPYLGHPRLARGCGPCDWFLLTADPDPVLLRRDGCDARWRPVWPGGRWPVPVAGPVAVAIRDHQLAVADRARVLVWAREGELLRAVIDLPEEPSLVAPAPWGEVLVALRGRAGLLRFTLDGEPCGPASWRPDDEITGIAFGTDPADPRACPLILRDAGGRLWRAERDTAQLTELTPARLAALVEPSALTAASAAGFCLTEPDEAGEPVARCTTWSGRPAAPGEIAAAAPEAYARRGQLLTDPLDSGVPGCAWHRVRLDAGVPAGTTLQVSLATSDVPPAGLTAQGDVRIDPGWDGLAAGVPHPDDWQVLPDGARDVLVTCPAGRYLFVRVRLTGDGHGTPVLHRVRLDLPRSTSLDLLPAVYRTDPVAADFTARFLSLLDGVVDDLDEVLERYPALLDTAGVPDAVLPWLAGLVGLRFDPAWPAARRRALLAAAPELYRLRGTPAGLARAVRQVFDVDPVITELGHERSWGALGATARLGGVRLFGRARARFRLGASALSQAPLRGDGDPDRDAQAAGAHRFVVHVPAGVDGPDRDALARLVESQAPAHTVARVRFGRAGPVVGTAAVVGADTALVPPPAPVLGRTARLCRSSVLRPGPRGPGPALRVGERSVVGVHTRIG